MNSTKKTILGSIVLLITFSLYGQDYFYENSWHKFNTPNGYIHLGPINGSGAHIYTGLSRFFFNKRVELINGELSAYQALPLKFLTNAAVRMQINGDGNVGIGTTSPNAKLHVYGETRLNGNVTTAATTFTINASSQKNASIWLTDPFAGPSEAGHYYIKAYDYWGAYLHFQGTGDNGNERLNVTFDGNVGIGTENPSNIQSWSRVLDVRGSSSKILATTSNETYKTGVYSHSSWHGGGGFIGTESDHNLHFLTGYSPKMTIKTDGKVGIGMIDPVASLEIKGQSDSYGLLIRDKDNSEYLGVTQKDGKSYFSDNAASGNYFLRGSGANIEVRGDIFVYGSDIYDNNGPLRLNGEDDVRISMDYNNNDNNTRNISFGKNDRGGNANWEELMRIQENGNVGIGIDAPTAKLHVDGNIISEEVKVEVVNGPDYVFEPDYDLRTLEETKQYITENKHLPEIPPAAEMEENGVELGEMNMLLLKKIEELTLHMIRQQSQIEALKEEITSLKNNSSNQ
jgi:hypothetical protein